MHLSLLVLRSAIPDQLAQFYTQLGCTFEHHRHGTGPLHYSAYIGQTLLEIYPLTKSQEKADPNIRLGFAIDNFTQTLETLAGFIIHPPTESEFGLMAIIKDPEDRKIEIYKN